MMLLHERVGVEKGEAIEKHYNTQNSSWYQQFSVPGKPEVVQSHLLPEVRPARRKQTNTCWYTITLHFTIYPLK